MNRTRTELAYILRLFWRHWGRELAIILVAGILAAGSLIHAMSSAGERLDIEHLRFFFSLRGPLPAPPDVVIAAIDDVSVHELQVRSTRIWPRIHTARTLERIVSAKPKALILDAKAGSEDLDPAADDVLEEALRGGPTTIWSGEIAQSEPSTLGTRHFSSLTFPSDERFRRAAKMELPMWTSTTRGLKLLIAASPREDASLYERVPLARPLIELARFHIDAPGPDAFINYYGPPGTIRSVPLATVLRSDPRELATLFGGKVVLFGYASEVMNRGLGNKDAFAVPVSDRSMFGVEIHATIAANLIEHAWLSPLPPSARLRFVLLSVFLLNWAAIRLRPEIGIPVALAGLLGIGGWSYERFVDARVFTASLGSVVVWVAAGILVSCLFNYKVIRRRIQAMNRAFGLENES